MPIHQSKPVFNVNYKRPLCCHSKFSLSPMTPQEVIFPFWSSPYLAQWWWQTECFRSFFGITIYKGCIKKKKKDSTGSQQLVKGKEIWTYQKPNLSSQKSGKPGISKSELFSIIWVVLNLVLSAQLCTRPLICLPTMPVPDKEDRRGISHVLFLVGRDAGALGYTLMGSCVSVFNSSPSCSSSWLLGSAAQPIICSLAISVYHAYS